MQNGILKEYIEINTLQQGFQQAQSNRILHLITQSRQLKEWDERPTSTVFRSLGFSTFANIAVFLSPCTSTRFVFRLTLMSRSFATFHRASAKYLQPNITGKAEL